MRGSRLELVDRVATGVLALAVVAAGVLSNPVVQAVHLGVSAALFVGGCVAFTAGFLRAVGRSRTEEIDLAGLFYLTGSAPPEVRRSLLGLWFAQIAVATVSVFITSPPFAVMAPVWGIGVLTLWSSRHGKFQTRRPRSG